MAAYSAYNPTIHLVVPLELLPLTEHYLAFLDNSSANVAMSCFAQTFLHLSDSVSDRCKTISSFDVLDKFIIIYSNISFEPLMNDSNLDIFIVLKINYIKLFTYVD